MRRIDRMIEDLEISNESLSAIKKFFRRNPSKALAKAIKKAGGSINPFSKKEISAIEDILEIKLNDEIKEYFLMIGQFSLKYRDLTFKSYDASFVEDRTSLQRNSELEVYNTKLDENLVSLLDVTGGGEDLMYDVSDGSLYFFDRNVRESGGVKINKSLGEVIMKLVEASIDGKDFTDVMA